MSLYQLFGYPNVHILCECQEGVVLLYELAYIAIDMLLSILPN